MSKLRTSLAHGNIACRSIGMTSTVESDEWKVVRTFRSANCVANAPRKTSAAKATHYRKTYMKNRNAGLQSREGGNLGC